MSREEPHKELGRRCLEGYKLWNLPQTRVERNSDGEEIVRCEGRHFEGENHPECVNGRVCPYLIGKRLVEVPINLEVYEAESIIRVAIAS